MNNINITDTVEEEWFEEPTEDFGFEDDEDFDDDYEYYSDEEEEDEEEEPTPPAPPEPAPTPRLSRNKPLTLKQAVIVYSE